MLQTLYKDCTLTNNYNLATAFIFVYTCRMQNAYAPALPPPLTVVVAADKNFSIPLALCIKSLLTSAHRETRYDIHILDDGVNGEVKSYLQTLQSTYDCTITHHDVSHKVEGVAANRQFPKVAFARFILEDYLPQQGSERIFYTDADVLICEDLTPLFNMDMGEYALAAPQAINLISSERYEYLNRWSKLYNLNLSSAPGAYFQSGNLLIDRKLWKERGYGAKIVEMGMKADLTTSPMPDQDIMNAVCWGDIALLPAKYCVIPLFEKRYERKAYHATYENRCAYSADELEQAICHPAVLHFAGRKPQVLQGPRYAGEEAFINFWKKSPWYDYLPYSPPRDTQSAGLFLNSSRRLSEQRLFLQRKALKYSILAHLTTGARRERYKMWAAELKAMLKAMKH